MPIVGSIDFKARKKAAWISFFTSFAVLALKVYAYFQTRSTAVLSDALESIANVVTAIVAVFVISYVAQPADEEHPYGHGKAEFFSSAFEGGLIFFAALMILIESVKAYIQQTPLQSIEWGVFYVMAATLLNLLVGFHLRQVGRKEKSETLTASGAHLLSDVKTTVGVALGLVVVQMTGWQRLDAIVAFAVGLHLLYEGFLIVRRSFSGLVDAMDKESLEILSGLIKKHRRPGVIDLHHLRAIRSGSFHHIDAHLVVPEFWDVHKAHEVTHEFEEKVVTDYPFDGEFAFHLDPCKRSFCKKCDLSDCPVRSAPFEQLYSFSVTDLVQGPQKTNEPKTFN